MTSGGPACPYLTPADIATVISGSFSTATRVDPQQVKGEFCSWNRPSGGDGAGFDILVSTALAAFVIDADKAQLKNLAPSDALPGVGDLAVVVGRKADGSGVEIKFFKGTAEVALTLSKPTMTPADFDALVALAKKVAAQLGSDAQFAPSSRI